MGASTTKQWPQEEPQDVVSNNPLLQIHTQLVVKITALLFAFVNHLRALIGAISETNSNLFEIIDRQPCGLEVDRRVN